VKIERVVGPTRRLSATLKLFYIDGAAVRVLAARVYKNAVIARLEGVETLSDAELLRNKTVCIARADAQLPGDRYFIADLIGLDAVDADTGEHLGVIRDILPLEPNTVYVIDGAREILVPAVDEFVKKIDPARAASGFI
jgi:16S rRNA processing protein RimM